MPTTIQSNFWQCSTEEVCRLANSAMRMRLQCCAHVRSKVAIMCCSARVRAIKASQNRSETGRRAREEFLWRVGVQKVCQLVCKERYIQSLFERERERRSKMAEYEGLDDAALQEKVALAPKPTWHGVAMFCINIPAS